MYSRTLKRRVASFEAVQKDASGTRRGPEVGFRLDLRPDFRGRREKWQEKKEMTGDGAREWTSEKTDFWAVATPLLAAFSRPTPSAPGVATAQVGQRICSLRRWRNFKQTTQQI